MSKVTLWSFGYWSRDRTFANMYNTFDLGQMVYRHSYLHILTRNDLEPTLNQSYISVLTEDSKQEM